VHYSPSCAPFTLLFLLDTIVDVQVLNLIPKEGEGESFEDALARVRRCLGGGGATDNADSDSDLEVVTESVTVNLRCPVSVVLHIYLSYDFFFVWLCYIYVSTIYLFQFFSSYQYHFFLRCLVKGGPGASGRVLPPVTGRSRVRVAVSSHCTGEGQACH